MKKLIAVFLSLAQLSCVTTKPKEVDLCLSSPQKTSNAIQCESQDINKKPE